MSQTAQQNAPAFVFQEHLEYDGEQYDLVFDPGNPNVRRLSRITRR